MIDNKLNKNQDGSLNSNISMIPISVVADILSVHQRTLRIYDEENILKPSRSGTNRRLYSFNDIEKGKFIQYLTRDLGINLAGTKVIIHLLAEKNLSQDQYLEYVKNVASLVDITLETQQENRIKLSRRGRKPNSAA